MQFTTEYFQKLEDAQDSLSEALGLEHDFMENSTTEVEGTVEVVQTSDHIIVASLQYDSSASSEFFEHGDGNGELTIFRSATEYNTTLDKLENLGKLFYLVDRYQHGNVHYSVAGSRSYADSQWDVASGCGVFVPCDDVQEQFQKMKSEQGEMAAFEHFTQDSNNILDSYSSWCNGEVYGYLVSIYNKNGELEDTDESWNIIGEKDAKHYMQESIQYQYESSVLNHLMKDIEIEKNQVVNVPFAWDNQNVQHTQLARIYDSYILAVQYQEENKAIVYHYDSKTETLEEGVFEAGTRNHYVTAELFLNARMQSDMKEVLRRHHEQKEAETQLKP